MVIIPNADATWPDVKSPRSSGSELGGLETWTAEGTKAPALSIGRSVLCSTAMVAAGAGALGSRVESSSALRSEWVDRKRNR